MLNVCEFFYCVRHTEKYAWMCLNEFHYTHEYLSQCNNNGNDLSEITRGFAVD